MKVEMTAVAVVLAAFLGWMPASAAAETITVSPGESIQDAINRADPGGKIKLKPGTYRENIQIIKEDIELEGAGADSTRLEPPATPKGPCGTDPAFVIGICVANIDPEFNPLGTVREVEISDLTVDGFSGFGILVFHATGIEIHDVVASDNGEYGIFALDSSNGEYKRNDTPRNGEAGIYVGDSPQARTELEDNTSTGNNIGIFIRDTSFGEIEDNSVSGNCVGILFLNDAAGVGNWEAEDNDVVANNRACPASPDGEEPALSGIGIATFGAHDIRITDNNVRDNEPSGPSVVSGGIVVAGDPGAPSSNVHVEDNVALGNEPFDLVWDRNGSGNEFEDNVCETSDPPGLCERDHGDDDDDEGDDDGSNGHHGDHGDDDDDHGHNGNHGDRDDDEREHHGDHEKHNNQKHHDD
jgi:parallel beta-helix repeat protein